jgi:hypothetical protein
MQRKLATVFRDVGDRTVRFVLSDGTVDRMGDTVAVGGWDLVAYKRIRWFCSRTMPAHRPSGG